MRLGKISLLTVLLLTSCKSTYYLPGMYEPAGASKVSANGPSTPNNSNKAPSVSAPSNDNSSEASQKMRESLVRTANRYIGCKYKAGSSGPKRFDCSGFTSFVFQQYNIILPRTSSEQFHVGVAVNDTKKLCSGDLVFWKGSDVNSKEVGHVGIVVDVDAYGNFTFVHAALTGVQTDHSDAVYYKVRYMGARRIIK